MITTIFKQRKYGAEFIGLTTLNAAPLFRLIAGGNQHTATSHYSARLWLSDQGLKRGKAIALIDAARRGEEGILSAGASGSASADQQQANR